METRKWKKKDKSLRDLNIFSFIHLVPKGLDKNKQIMMTGLPSYIPTNFRILEYDKWKTLFYIQAKWDPKKLNDLSNSQKPSIKI